LQDSTLHARSVNLHGLSVQMLAGDSAPAV
jgi:hypothetical protein